MTPKFKTFHIPRVGPTPGTYISVDRCYWIEKGMSVRTPDGFGVVVSITLDDFGFTIWINFGAQIAGYYPNQISKIREKERN